MAYSIYLRKSRQDTEAEQRGEGETLARHERILLEVAKKQQLHIEKIYKEVVSGETIAARPVMQQLLAEVEQGIWEGVLVVEIDRLARGATIDQGIMAQAFKYSNTKIITPNKTYDPNNDNDEQFFEFSLFMSRQEYKTINRRLQRGRMSSIKEGKFVANATPYGYIRRKLENQQGFILVPHPEESKIVKMIFDWYVNGYDGKRLGVALIVKKLNEMGIASQKNNGWAKSTIQNIIKNPAYCGKIRWNNRKQIKQVIDGEIKITRPRAKKEDCILSEGLHEKIIDVELFEKANNIIESNRPVSCPSNHEIKSPLSGLVKCGMCGRSMIRRVYDSSKERQTLMCFQSSCKNKSSDLNVVEAEIIKALKKWALNYEAEIKPDKESYIDITILENNIKSLDTDISKLKNQINTAHDLLEQRVYNIDTFLDRTNVINTKIKESESQKKYLLSQIESINKQREAKEKVIPTVNSVINNYYSCTEPAIKNELLKSVLEKVIYTKTKKATKKNPLGDMTLELYPNIQK